MSLRYLLLSVPLFLAVGLSAQPLDLPDLVQAALRTSESLQIDDEELAKAEQRYSQAKGALAPSLSLGGAYLRQDDSVTGAGGESAYGRLRLEQPLLRGLREYAALRAAGASLAYQAEAREWGRSRAALDVAQAYYSVLSLAADQAIVAEQLDLLDERQADLKRWVGIGRSRPGEVLNVQAARASLASQQQQLKAQESLARELLAFLCSLEPGFELAPAPEGLPDLPDLAGLLKGVGGRRADFRAAAKNVELAQAQVGVARGGHGPNIDVSANYYPWRTGGQKDVAWDAAVTASLPLFAGFTVSSQVRQAEAAAGQAALALKRLKRSAAADLRSLHASLAADLAQVQALAEARDLAEKSWQADVKDYNLGLVNNLQVLQSLNSAKEAGRALNRARYAAHAGLRRLEAAAGLDQALTGAR